jgi:hypothetical protein
MTDCGQHGLPFGREAAVAQWGHAGWYVERCMHLGNRFVVDVRHVGAGVGGWHAHIDLVERDAEGAAHVIEAHDAPLAEADWDWDTLVAELLDLDSHDFA